MIHSGATILDHNTPQASPDPEPSPAAPRVPFRRPADYYSAPRDARPLFPRWVPFGCGTAAIVVLVLVFAAGITASRGGMGELFDLMFSSIEGEAEKIFTKDVTPSEKAEFEEEMKTMREGVRTNRIRIDRLQPLLRSIREVSEDEHITPAETERLIKELREVNKTAKR